MTARARFFELQSEAFPKVPLEEQTNKWKVLKTRAKAANVIKWAQCSQDSMRFWGESERWGRKANDGM
jgi:hypothetical protein